MIKSESLAMVGAELKCTPQTVAVKKGAVLLNLIRCKVNQTRKIAYFFTNLVFFDPAYGKESHF